MIRKTTDIRKHDMQSMGIAPFGFDYTPVERILADIGPQLTVPHRHEYYEILWFTHCRGKHMVEFITYDLTPNTLFVFSRNQIHAFINITDLKGHLLRFSKTFLRRLPESYTAAMTHSLFKMHDSPVRQLSDENVLTLSSLINLINSESQQPHRPFHENMLALLLHAFLIEIERLKPLKGDLSNERWTTLKTYYQFSALLEKYYIEHYPVEHYAELLGLSAKRLGEICKQAAGMTPKRIIEEHLGLEAKRLLRHSDLSIKEISFRLGFEDPAYFSRFFKKTVSMSPSAFRISGSEMYQQKQR
jgi:AraC family transcriptional regulator, transcriptional activator of pobA